MKWWQATLCVWAWRILWKWWPDRVLYALVPDYREHPSDPWGVIIETGTPSCPHREKIDKASLVWMKLDHSGILVKGHLKGGRFYG